MLPAGIDAGVDTTDEGADDIGRLFATDAGVEVTGTTAPDELGSNDATTAVPDTVKTFEAEVAISRAKYNYGNFASARQESRFSSPPTLLMPTVQTGLFFVYYCPLYTPARHGNPNDSTNHIMHNYRTILLDPTCNCAHACTYVYRSALRRPAPSRPQLGRPPS